MKGFSIIIVTWNGLSHLKTFLPSVIATDYPDFEVILADNHSSDGSKEWVSEHYPSVKVVSFDNNYGYTGGNNRAAAFAQKEILVFLNNDVAVDANWLQGINELFEHNTQISAVQPKIRSYQQPEYFEYAGAAQVATSTALGTLFVGGEFYFLPRKMKANTTNLPKLPGPVEQL